MTNWKFLQLILCTGLLIFSHHPGLLIGLPTCTESVPSIIYYKINKSVPLECIVCPDEGEQVAKMIHLCFKVAGLYTLTSDLPPGIEVVPLRRGPNGVDGGIIEIKSVRITNPDRGELILWCCQIEENGTIVEREHHHLIKISNDDDPGGTTGNNTGIPDEIQTPTTPSNTSDSSTKVLVPSIIFTCIAIMMSTFLLYIGTL